MASDLFNARFLLAVLFAPLAVLVFVAVLPFLTDWMNDRPFRPESYLQSVVAFSFVSLLFAYAGVFGIGVPIHVALKRRGRTEYRYYAICGLSAGIVIGIGLGALIELASTELSFLTPLIHCVICGWLVSSAFWLLVRNKNAAQDAT